MDKKSYEKETSNDVNPGLNQPFKKKNKTKHKNCQYELKGKEKG